VLALIVQRLLELLGGDAPLFEKQFANTDGHEFNWRLVIGDE
jgi:hypothetical protein